VIRIHDVTDQRGESYAILTVCRALYSHHTGEPVSKTKAARWVTARYPERSSLIDMALERRASPDANGSEDTFAATVAFIKAMVTEIDEGANG
jgi:hypothetical protein